MLRLVQCTRSTFSGRPSAYVLVMLVIVVVLFDRTQIPREERYLQEKFGEDYSRYKTKVRRWI